MNRHIDLNAIRDDAPVEEFSDELTDEALDRDNGLPKTSACTILSGSTRAPLVDD